MQLITNGLMQHLYDAIGEASLSVCRYNDENAFEVLHATLDYRYIEEEKGVHISHKTLAYVYKCDDNVRISDLAQNVVMKLQSSTLWYL